MPLIRLCPPSVAPEKPPQLGLTAAGQHLRTDMRNRFIRHCGSVDVIGDFNIAVLRNSGENALFFQGLPDDSRVVL